MLDLDFNRAGVTPRDAATLVVVREAPDGLEVFCVERHPKSGFLGGAIVFPGGKVDAHDASDEWIGAVDLPADPERALRIATCREALEEAAILPITGGSVTHAELLALRSGVEKKEGSILDFLGRRGLRLHLSGLHPFARWITPIAEQRRFDTRFYLTALPSGQEGAHDERETTSSFWASAAKVLSRFDQGRVQLAPPTHRTLEVLAHAKTSAEAIAIAARACLDPICPRLVPQEGALTLVLPGDPEHEIPSPRIEGRSRFVLRGDRWLPEDPPRAR